VCFETWRFIASIFLECYTIYNTILDPPFGKVQKSRVVTKASPSPRVGRALRRSLPKPRHGSSTSPLRQPSFPPVPAIQEPFQGAWLSEGDVVEGKYNCVHNGTFRLLHKIGCVVMRKLMAIPCFL
jgi:hypothetical protein